MIEQFLNEKKYLDNVSEKTLELYKYSFAAFAGALDDMEQVKARIVELRTKNMKPVTVNTYVRHIKCYFLWQDKEFKLSPLKEEQRLLSTISANDISALVRYKAVGTNLLRAHVVALLVLDCGLRAAEATGLTLEHVDLDNLVIKVVNGKGGKHRLVPFSPELRKHLFRYTHRHGAGKGVYLFGTKNNTKVSVRNLERDFKLLGEKVSIPHLHPHLLRHTFACCYLRQGGNLEYLRRILGHSSLSTTQKYLRSLGVADLSAAHQAHSPLANRGR